VTRRAFHVAIEEVSVRRTLIALATLAALMAVAAPVAAIGDGELDVEDHPYVFLSVHDVDGVPSHRCSGAFIDAYTFVTAGHCTYGTSGGRVFLQADVDAGRPENGYPGPSKSKYNVEAAAAYTHPDYVDALFFLYDVGVLKFKKAVYKGPYASLPQLDEMDLLGDGRNEAIVTAVGYGLQELVEGPDGVGPDFDPKLQADRVRYQADLMVVDVNGVAGIGSINPGQSAALSSDAAHGGTCFGDSGGPILEYGTDVIFMVNSFGLDRNCSAIGGGYRVDRADDLNFLHNIKEVGYREF
jgi:Trypsin